MIESLRPSTLGEILDRTVQLYRTRFLVFFGIAAIPAGVVLVGAAGTFLFSAWSGSGGFSGLNPAAQTALSIAFLLCFLLILVPICIAATAMGSAALSQAASAAYLGETINIRDACRAAWKRGWRYIWLFTLEIIIVGVAPFILWLVSAFILGILAVVAKQSGSDMSTAGPVLILTFMALLAGCAIWMLLRLCLAFPACVVEQIPVWASIRRANSLSKGTRGRIFLVYLLGIVLSWLLALLLTLPVMIIASLIPGAGSPQHQQMLGTIFLFTFYGASFAVQALTKPVYAIALVLFYYDQRIRKEGFDIEWMMRQAGMVAAPPKPEATPWLPPVAKRPPPPEPTPAPLAGAIDERLAGPLPAELLSPVDTEPSAPGERV